MPRLRRRLAVLAAAALLAAPSAALGQSAGDEQYEDPFAGEQPREQPAEPTPAPAEPAPAAPAQAPEPPPVPAPVEPAAQPAELPRTGLDAGSVLAIGAVLLAAGVVLRVRLRERA